MALKVFTVCGDYIVWQRPEVEPTVYYLLIANDVSGLKFFANKAYPNIRTLLKGMSILLRKVHMSLSSPNVKHCYIKLLHFHLKK